MMRISPTHRLVDLRLALLATLLLSAGCSGWKFDWETGRFYDERRTTVRPGDGYEPQRSTPQPAPTRTASTVKPQPATPQQPQPAPAPPQPAPRPAPSPIPANDQITVASVPASSAPRSSTSPPSVSSSSSAQPSAPVVSSTAARPSPAPSNTTVTNSPVTSASQTAASPSVAPSPEPPPQALAASTSPPPPPPAAPASPPPPPPAPPAPRPSASAAPSESPDGGYHRLLLVTGAVDSAEDSRTTQYVLRQATPRQAGQLLATLYRPLGPGGSETRYFLVYPTHWELDAAQKMVAALDVAASGASTSSAADSFALLVAEYYRVTDASDLPAAPKLAADLAAFADRTDLYGPHRWAALMMAGILQGELLGDLAAAQQLYERAQHIAPPDSIESLTAGLARIEGLSFFGRRAEAADQAKRLVVAHQAYSRTAAYAECLRLAGP